jgi:hypothetical protein
MVAILVQTEVFQGFDPSGFPGIVLFGYVVGA